MSTITLQNFRVGSDLTVKVRLKDGGVAIDWSTLSGIRAVLYSDAQSSIAGRCDVTVDGEDPTLLVCRYAATKMQYLGVNRIVVSAKYMGMTKTYDKPAFTFVRWTEDQAGEEIAIEDPEVTVEIDVEDVSSSILQEAVDAAFSAADRANEAAEAAEHMVDIHTGPEGKSAYEVAVEEGYTGTEEEWLASLKGPVGETPDISIGTVTTVEPGTPAAASMSGTPEAPVLNLSIPKGLVGATPNITVGTVTTGQPGTPVVITITGTAEAPVLNVTIPQGLKGDTGVSADYPITIHNGLDSDATDEALAAAQGKILDGKVSQLEAKVAAMPIPVKYTNGYIKTSDPIGTVVDMDTYVSLSPWMCYVTSCKPGDVAIVSGTGGLSPRLWAFLDEDYKILSQSAASVTENNARITAPQHSSWIIVNDNSGQLSYIESNANLTELERKVDKQGEEIVELESVLDYAENPEYIQLYTDANDRFLFGIREDGSVDWAKGVPKPIKDYVGSRFTDEQFEELIGLLKSHYCLSDPEGRLEMTLDENSKILSYRGEDGIKVENVGLKTPSLSANMAAIDKLLLSGDGVDELIQEIKDRGFSGGAGDWSDAEKLAIPMPRCAVINLTTRDGSMAVWPTTKTSDFEYWMQFWDMQGNYFKKRVIFNAQGNSSLGMPKKNGAIDICNDEWEGDDTFALKVGDWVPQDSFHLKGYYADYFIGVAVIGYEIFDRITKTRDIYSKRDWIKYLVPDKATIGLNSQATEGLSDNLSLDNDARCFPDGFPVLVYLDSVFYGVFSWQLKKHRDNYQMDKNNANEIHLDGMISYDSIFLADGTLPWSVINGTTPAPSGGSDGIEVRNPKSLICVDGTKYDGDNNRKELISTTSPGYDPNNANMVRTAQVRAAMEQLSTYIPTLQTMESGGSTAAQIREQFASFFDVQAIIDYQIFGDFFLNTDGFRKNWQWITWDGVKWLPEPYDLDAILGWTGWGVISPTNDTHLGHDMRVPTGWLQTYFHTEMEARYKELRDSGVLSASSVTNALQDWIARIGTKNYNADHKLWPYDKAHYPDAGTVYTRVDSIFRVANWIEQRITYCDTLYNY